MMNPTRKYETPEAVLHDPDLSTPRKIEVLRNWEYDEREVAVAVEEGMPGPDPLLLGRIHRALDELTAGPNLESSPPTKQGGSSG